MRTQDLNIEQGRTAEVLASMMTENTGISFMDSGGDKNRHWQRNAGLTASEFLGQKSATWERNWSVTLNVFTFCLDRLNYSKRAEVLTRLMNVWEAEDPENHNPYGLSEQLDYLESLGADIEGDHWNTYNWDTLLSQNLQGVDFTLGGRSYVMLQVHGGADARGGYTRPVIFEAPESWIWGCNSAQLYCESCNIGGPLDSEAEWYRYGEQPAPLFGEAERYVSLPEGYDMANGCPECSGDLTAEAEEYYL